MFVKLKNKTYYYYKIKILSLKYVIFIQGEKSANTDLSQVLPMVNIDTTIQIYRTLNHIFRNYPLNVGLKKYCNRKYDLFFFLFP